MVIKIYFKDYYPISSLELAFPSTIKLNESGFIRISSKRNKKSIFNFYKEEMQQGLPITDCNSGKIIIRSTGYFDLHERYSWTSFNDFVGTIIYKYKIKEGRLEVIPLNMSNEELPNNEVILDI